MWAVFDKPIALFAETVVKTFQLPGLRAANSTPFDAAVMQRTHI
jgi:hypothetical protein